MSGQAWDYSSIEWATSGDGTFSDASILDPVYTPGEDDIADGEATLTLTAYDNNNNEASDAMELTILPYPVAYAGEDDTICGDQTLSITDAYATDYTSLLWTTSGNGTFSNSTIINPTYTPGGEDIIAGEATLTLTAYGCEDESDDRVVTIIAPAYADAGDDATNCAGESFTVTTATADNSLCDDVSDDMQLYIAPTPTAYAGDDDEFCETASYELSGFATNWSSLLWTTDGDGIFDDPNLEAAVYTPGDGDIYEGSVILHLTAQPVSPCTESESDLMTLVIGRVAQVDAGDDILICADDFALLNGTAENASYIQWNTAGDGTFEDPTSLTTEYYPGVADQSTGEVDLTLTGWSTEPCDEEVWDNLVLLLQPEPQIEADPEPAIFENEVYTFDGGSAYYYSNVMWYTSGDGTFDDPTHLYAVYEPGLQDIESGQVELELTLWPVEPCMDELVTDILLSIGQLPFADAGEDTLICEDEEYLLSGTASNYSSVLWTSYGNGTFNDPTMLGPTYYPGEEDILNGSVQIELEALPVQPCDMSGYSTMQLSFSRLSEVFAGEDAEICNDETYTVYDAWAAHYSSVIWSHDGEGELPQHSYTGTNLSTS